MEPLDRMDADLQAVASSLGYLQEEGVYHREADCLGALLFYY